MFSFFVFQVVGVEVSRFPHEAGYECGWFAACLEFGGDDLGFGVVEVGRARSVYELHDEARPVVVDHEFAGPFRKAVVAIVGEEEFW